MKTKGDLSDSERVLFENVQNGKAFSIIIKRTLIW